MPAATFATHEVAAGIVSQEWKMSDQLSYWDTRASKHMSSPDSCVLFR